MQQTLKPQTGSIAIARSGKAAGRKPQVIAPYRVDLPRRDKQPIAVPCDINGRSLIDGRL